MFFLFLRKQYKERRLSKTLAAVCYFHNHKVTRWQRERARAARAARALPWAGAKGWARGFDCRATWCLAIVHGCIQRRERDASAAPLGRAA